MTDAKSLTDDILIGARAIADYSGLTRRQIYAMREAQNPLIDYEPGLGLVARKSTLEQRFGRRLASAAEHP